MALVDLLAALEREAAATAERLIAEARAEAERLAAGSTVTLDQRREGEVARVMAGHRAAIEAEVARARAEGRRAALAARARLLERVDRRVRDAFPQAVSRPDHLATVGGRLAAGLACFEAATAVTARCPAALVDAIRAAAPADRPFVVEVDPSIGAGFRLVAADGGLEVEDTLEGRHEALRGVLAREALRDLVGE